MSHPERPHSKPRLRDDHHLERHASWLELFYDLIFAVTISQLAHHLQADLSPRTLAEFLGLFVPVWWAWVGQTMFSTRFESDDPVQRVFTLFQMLCAAIMAVQLGGMDLDAFHGFAFAYAALRACLVLQYVRVWRHDPGSREISGYLARVFAVGTVLAFASAFATPMVAWPLWLGAMAADIIGPRLASSLMRSAPVHRGHLPERLALFTLIFLGESLAAEVRGLAAADLWLPSVLIGVLSFGVAASLWWVYFDHFSRPDVGERVRSGQSVLFAHLPLLLGLAFMVGGVERALQESSDYSLSPQTALLLFGGTTLWLAAFVLAKAVTVPATVAERRAWPEAGVALVAVLLFIAHGELRPLVAMLVLALAMVALVVLHERRKHAA